MFLWCDLIISLVLAWLSHSAVLCFEVLRLNVQDVEVVWAGLVWSALARIGDGACTNDGSQQRNETEKRAICVRNVLQSMFRLSMSGGCHVVGIPLWEGAGTGKSCRDVLLAGQPVGQGTSTARDQAHRDDSPHAM